MQLTGRDVVLLLNVYKYRYLSFSQLTRLHFPSTVSAYRRLRLLIAGNYLKAFTAPNMLERIFYLLDCCDLPRQGQHATLGPGRIR